MSDSTQAAKIGAEAAQKAAQTVATPEPSESSFGAAVSRARSKMATAASVVGDKVSTGLDSAKEGLGGAVEAARRDSDDPADARPSASIAGPARAGGPARRTRKARLRLSRIDPWSVFKTMLLFSMAGAIITLVATWVVWGVINATGVFEAVNEQVNKLVATPGAENTFKLEDYVNTNKVLGFTALVGALNVVLLTALGTIFAFLYNLASTVMGGLEVTLAED